jgi:hypothetical protein
MECKTDKNLKSGYMYFIMISDDRMIRVRFVEIPFAFTFPDAMLTQNKLQKRIGG